MRLLSSFARRAALSAALISFACAVCLFEPRVLIAAPAVTAQQQQPAQAKAPEVKVSDGESKLGEKIEKAPDAAAKLAAAEEFVNKYPKSPLRPQIVQYLSGQIMGVTDAAQKVTLAEKFLSLFTQAGEGVHLAPVLIDSYLAAQRFDDAFRAGAAYLATTPDDARILAPLAFHGIDQARRNNAKFTGPAQQYLPKAVALLEAGTRPAGADETHFNTFKTAWLPQLYQVQSVLAINAGNFAEAAARAQKAIALNPRDPGNYYVVGFSKDREYEQMAAQYKAMPEGPQKQEMLGKINAQMDEIIDYYARTVAAAEGHEQHKGLRDQVLQDMTTYYKFRHNGSTDGMQALIDKYKQPAPPQP
jgi:hypothetical protein